MLLAHTNYNYTASMDKTTLRRVASRNLWQLPRCPPPTVSHKLLHDGRNRFISGNGYTDRLSPQPSMSHSPKSHDSTFPGKTEHGS